MKWRSNRPPGYAIDIVELTRTPSYGQLCRSTGRSQSGTRNSKFKSLAWPRVHFSAPGHREWWVVCWRRGFDHSKNASFASPLLVVPRNIIDGSAKRGTRKRTDRRFLSGSIIHGSRAVSIYMEFDFSASGYVLVRCSGFTC
jgi:hypothetical protein